MLQLKNSLKALPKIKEILSSLHYDQTIDTFPELYDLLEKKY